MKLPNFQNPPADSSTKIGHDFINKDVQDWKLSENSLVKNVPLNQDSSLKTNQKDFNDSSLKVRF